MTVTRREFIANAGVGAALAAVSGCAAASMYSVAPSNGRLRVDLTALPELQRDGGVATIAVAGEDAPVFVVRDSATSFHALSAVCTHRGCTIESKGARFECPCHGSRYQLTGEVERGPAELPLRKFRATVDANGRELTIEYAPSGRSA